MTARTLLFTLVLAAVPAAALVHGIVEAKPAAPSAAPFVCDACHAALQEVQQTPLERAARAHDPVVDEGMANAVDRENPDLLILDGLAHFYGPVPFSHRIHAGMSQMNGSCANCHHELETGTEILACESCHPAELGATLAVPSLKGAYHRQCLGCHRDWAHANACGYCHEETEKARAHTAPADTTDIIGIPHPRITAEDSYTYQTAREGTPIVTFHHVDHVDLYGLRCVDCHQGHTCGRCHDETISREQIDRIETCGGCHDCNKEQSCDFCHATEARPKFDHKTSTTFALEPNHTQVPCESCHGSGSDFKKPSDNCRVCHGRLPAGCFDHGVTGVPLTGSHSHFGCQACHAARDPEAPASCNGCHADFNYPAYNPGVLNPHG